MIGERLAGAENVQLGRRQRSRLFLPSARAGRERLAEALGQSVLVQLMLAMSFVVLAALLYLAQASQVSVLQFNIADLQSQGTQLTADNASLHAEATALRSVQRVESMAANNLHMTKPVLSTTVWITPEMPRIASLPPVHADAISAERESRPLAWMQHAYVLLQQSL